MLICSVFVFCLVVVMTNSLGAFSIFHACCHVIFFVLLPLTPTLTLTLTLTLALTLTLTFFFSLGISRSLGISLVHFVCPSPFFFCLSYQQL